MSTTAAERTTIDVPEYVASPILTPCPPWCEEHAPTERIGDLGFHGAEWRREFKGEPVIGGNGSWTVQIGLFFNHDETEYGREVRACIKDDDGLTPEQARQLAADLVRAADVLEDRT